MSVTAAEGFVASGLHAGIKNGGRRDMSLLATEAFAQDSRPQEPIKRSSIPAPPTPGGQTPVGPPRLPDGATRGRLPA